MDSTTAARFSSVLAELTSAASQLGDIEHRVTRAAEAFHDAKVDDVAADLYEVERQLQAAHRRLDAMLRRV